MTSVLVVLTLLGSLVGTAAAQPPCAPTRPDMLGPFYKPDAPARARTGSGLVVSGAVRSTKGCVPLPGARVEWWSADERGEYRDELPLTADVPTRLILLGGVPFESPILMWWNFVGRTREEIDAATKSWNRDDGRFGTVASELGRIPAIPTPWR